MVCSFQKEKNVDNEGSNFLTIKTNNPSHTAISSETEIPVF